MPGDGRSNVHLAICRGGFYDHEMGYLDEDTSIMRHRLATTPIELRRPHAEPQTRARGIAIGTLLGAIVWGAAIAAAVLVWNWLR